MNTVFTLLLLVGAVLTPLAASAQTALYSASSKSQGAPFDITATETSRESNRSRLSVPGFHTRTAPAARWLMCVYTDLAFKRGFTHWVVAYPPDGSEIIVLGLSNAPEASPKELLGPDYAEERMLGKGMVPVEKFIAFCGLRK